MTAQIIDLNARRPYKPPPDDVVVGIRRGMVIVRRPDGLLAFKDAELVRMEQAYAGDKPGDTE